MTYKNGTAAHRLSTDSFGREAVLEIAEALASAADRSDGELLADADTFCDGEVRAGTLGALRESASFDISVAGRLFKVSVTEYSAGSSV